MVLSAATWLSLVGSCSVLAVGIAPENKTEATVRVPAELRQHHGVLRLLLDAGAEAQFGLVTWPSRPGQCLTVHEELSGTRWLSLSSCDNGKYQFFSLPGRQRVGSLQWAFDLESCIESRKGEGVVLASCNDRRNHQRFKVSADGSRLHIVTALDLCLGVEDAGNKVLAVSCREAGAQIFVKHGSDEPEPPAEAPQQSRTPVAVQTAWGPTHSSPREQPEHEHETSVWVTPPAPPPPQVAVQMPWQPSYDSPRKQLEHEHETTARATTPAPVERDMGPLRSEETPLFCAKSFTRPAAPLHATDLNSLVLDDVCFHGGMPHHVFVIGDWGGIGTKPAPADARGQNFGSKHRTFVKGVDDQAQLRVARVFNKRAADIHPDYVVNVGDNFYWGGVTISCGSPCYQVKDRTDQWRNIYENIYHGDGVDGKHWLGTLGNHDYGGFSFIAGWDQIIGYTWTTEAPSTGRWLTPAQYWSVRARYPDAGFEIDYYFIDSNVFDAAAPGSTESLHNICSKEHNPMGASCGPQGPTSIDDCAGWFQRLWEDQLIWLERLALRSTATYQALVTHFPPAWRPNFFKMVARRYGVELIITGHVHNQQVFHLDEGDGSRKTLVIISGGGGGITSESTPDTGGADDQYGFMDLTLTDREIMVEAISHGGHRRKALCVRPRPRPPGPPSSSHNSHVSLCDSATLGPIEGLAEEATKPLEQEFV